MSEGGYAALGSAIAAVLSIGAKSGAASASIIDRSATAIPGMLPHFLSSERMNESLLPSAFTDKAGY